MPSQMAEYIRDDLTSPCVYLWNPQDLGRLAAYTCLALVNGEIEGVEGEVVLTPELSQKSYKITPTEVGDGTEVQLNELIAFTPDNIRTWANVF